MNSLASDFILVLRHPKNRGFGAALRSGYAAACGRDVTLISGDGESVSTSRSLYRRQSGPRTSSSAAGFVPQMRAGLCSPRCLVG